MKKLIMILAVLALENMVFAAKTSISPVKVSYNQISSDSDGNLLQTVISDNGMSVTVGAELENDTIKYKLYLDNISDPNYLMRQDCIRTFYGNFDKDEWIENTYSAYANTSVPATTSSDEISTAEACLIAGATCLCALTLAEICDATTSTSSSRRVSSSSKVSRTPSVSPSRRTTTVVTPVPVFNWIIVDTDRSSNSSSVNKNVSTTTTNLTSGVRTGSSYTGTFYVPAGNGPDYKVRFTVSKNEYIDFYFSRSDRDSLVNPLKDRTYGRHSLLVSMGIPDVKRLGGYYLYSGKTVGAYGGFTLWSDDWTVYDIGTIQNFDINNVTLTRSNYYDSYRLVNIDDDKLVTDLFNFSGGLTIKTFPHTWLLVGCGLDIATNHFYGRVLDAENNEVDSGYILDTEPILAAAPQVGINLILDHFDIAATYQYSFYNGHRFDIMFGIAF